MTTVIVQCASRKRTAAGYLHDDDGLPVHIVANPQLAPSDGNRYCHPDDPISHTNATFRDLLNAYNDSPGTNPWNLLPAGELYDVPVYGELCRRVESSQLFILSAGWGLIRSDFLTPVYDITFSNQADAWKRRGRNDRYLDYCQLEADSFDDIVAFCTPAYHELLGQLIRSYRGAKALYRRAGDDSRLVGWQHIEYSTPARTNWHYECIRSVLS